jgi:hypothetical protein
VFRVGAIEARPDIPGIPEIVQSKKPGNPAPDPENAKKNPVGINRKSRKPNIAPFPQSSRKSHVNPAHHPPHHHPTRIPPTVMPKRKRKRRKIRKSPGSTRTARMIRPAMRERRKRRNPRDTKNYLRKVCQIFLFRFFS